MTEKKSSGIYLTWKDIDAHVKDTQILSNISGYCQPGTTLAIMGPSGAGKTTLLSILARKQSQGLKIKGIVQANNMPYSSKQFYSFASFVYQNDILNEVLTVRQTLEFTAKLKLKDIGEVQNRVDKLLNQFELRKCADTYVGGKVVKGISGGEKKRVCIAVEMVSEPQLLILDEPTSGLDSHIANNVIRILKKLSQQGKTVIFTIHQPSYKLYSQLDRLILLDKGSVIYQGSAPLIQQYMQKTLKINVPHNSTICDYFMFQISDYKLRMQKNHQSPLNNSTYKENMLETVDIHIKKLQMNDLQVQFNRKSERSFLQQFGILLSREWCLFMRNPMRFNRAIGNSVLTIVLIGLIFFHGISDGRPQNQQTYQIRDLIIYFIQSQGVCFNAVTTILMTGIFSVALVFPVEREVFSKQTASKTYDALPYFISKLLMEVFTLILSIVIFASGSYWLMGYTTSFTSFIGFVFVLIMVGFIGNSIGLMTGSLFKDAQKASSMAPALILPLMLFSGLYNKLDNIPKWISWLQYISPFRYGLHAILLNQYHEEEYYATIPFQTTPIIFDYRQDLSINLSYTQNVLILLGLSLFYYTLAFIFLKKLSSNINA